MNSLSPSRVLPLCSVVVPTLGRSPQLEACLKSLRGLDYSPGEVIVVHNDREDIRVRSIAETFSALYLSEPFRGLSRARNRGARAARCEIVAYLDDDASAERDWLSALVEEFADERVMAATGGIVPTRVETEAERLVAALGGFTVGDGNRLVLDRSNPRWFELACFGGIGNGGNMAFRRSAFEQWPGFDERLGAGAPIPGGEEQYAFFSLIDRGFRVAHAPDALVRHPFPATMEELKSRAAKQLATTAAYLMFLFAEQPRYRRRLASYILSWAFKGSRAISGRPRPGILGPATRLRAYSSGLGLFLESRRQRRPNGRG